MAIHFATASLRMGAGLLIWVAHFAAIYIYAALVCARGNAQLQWLGVPLVRLVIGATTVAAIAALALVFRSSLRGKWYADARRADQSFVSWVSAAVACYGLLAVLWSAMPAVWVAACPN